MEKRARRYYSVNDIKEILGVGQSKAYELASYFVAKGYAMKIGSVIRISMKKFDDWLVKMEEGEESLDIAAMPMEEIREKGRRKEDVPKRAEHKRKGEAPPLPESVIERVRNIGDWMADGQRRSLSEWEALEREREAEKQAAQRSRRRAARADNERGSVY